MLNLSDIAESYLPVIIAVNALNKNLAICALIAPNLKYYNQSLTFK
jgi:hypothetical protein